MAHVQTEPTAIANAFKLTSKAPDSAAATTKLTAHLRLDRKHFESPPNKKSAAPM